MIIQCTKKVLDKLSIKNAEKAPYVTAPGNEEMKVMLHSWHVNLLTIDRRKVLLFFNDLASVCVIVYRPQFKQEYSFEDESVWLCNFVCFSPFQG